MTSWGLTKKELRKVMRLRAEGVSWRVAVKQVKEKATAT